jgi:hypothetical protein
MQSNQAIFYRWNAFSFENETLEFPGCSIASKFYSSWRFLFMERFNRHFVSTSSAYGHAGL